MANFTQGPRNVHRCYIGEEGWKTYGKGENSFQNWDTTLAAGDTIIAEFTARIATNGGWPHVETIEEAKANFNLCMASPEMFSALQHALAILKAFGSDDELRDDTLMELVDEVIPQCSAALAKAEGK